MRFSKLITSILALVYSGFAIAGNMVLSWTPATQNTDGSAYTNAAGYTIVYGTGPTALTQSIAVNNPSVTSFTIPNLNNGTWYAAVESRSTSGAESANSNVVSKAVLDPPPPPPNLPMPPVVSVSARNVYSVVKRVDGFILLVVGTVPAGTQCDPTQFVNGKYAVPRAAVTWTGGVQPDVVVADCN